MKTALETGFLYVPWEKNLMHIYSTIPVDANSPFSAKSVFDVKPLSHWEN